MAAFSPQINSTPNALLSPELPPIAELNLQETAAINFIRMKNNLTKHLPPATNPEAIHELASFIFKHRINWSEPLPCDEGNVAYIGKKRLNFELERSLIYDRTLDLVLVLLNRKIKGDQLIGKGTNKNVTLALDPLSDCIYASGGLIPMTNEDGSVDEKAQENLEIAEINGFSYTKGLHGFVQLITYALYSSPKTPLKARFIMQYINGGTLEDNFKTLTPEAKWEITKSLFLSISQLHASGSIHRDLKPDNILLEKADGKIKPFICDVGSTCSLVDIHERVVNATTSWAASPEFASAMLLDPETREHYIAIRKAADTFLDIWGLGVLLYEMWENERPFWFLRTTAATFQTLIDNADHFEKHPKINLQSSLPIYRLLYAMLRKNPRDRISAEDCVEFSESVKSYNEF